MSPRDELQLQRERAAYLLGCDDMLAEVDNWISDAETVVQITTSEDARVEYRKRADLFLRLRADMVRRRDCKEP